MSKIPILRDKIIQVVYLFVFLLLISFLPPSIIFAHAGQKHSAEIFYNEACGACTTYLKEVLEPVLKENGVGEISWRDYIADSDARKDLNDILDKLEVPVNLQSHIMAFVSLTGGSPRGGSNDIPRTDSVEQGQVILAGHIPPQIIKDSFSANVAKLIILQDKMIDNPKSYKIWAFEGPVKEYSATTPLFEYIKWFKENKETFKVTELRKPAEFKILFPLIVVTGFLDGLNPCAFAVLLFFIAFLFSIKKTRVGILKMGVTYISAIYLAYLGIGIGLFKAIQLSGRPHFMAKVGAYLVIILGLINLLSLIFPEFPIRLKIPQFSKDTLSKWMYKSTIPAAFILGFLVGLCTFPCSGGPYVAIVSLLSAKVTYIKGLSYLLLYNLMFVSPLIIILVFTSNKAVTEKITSLEQAQSKRLHILGSLIMLGLGLVILKYFV